MTLIWGRSEYIAWIFVHKKNGKASETSKKTFLKASIVVVDHNSLWCCPHQLWSVLIDYQCNRLAILFISGPHVSLIFILHLLLHRSFPVFPACISPALPFPSPTPPRLHLPAASVHVGSCVALSSHHQPPPFSHSSQHVPLESALPRMRRPPDNACGLPPDTHPSPCVSLTLHR
jgi:hypothetical protein